VRGFKKVLIFAMLLCTTVLADPSKYIVEQHLSEVAQRTLDAMYGSGNFISKVSVQMTDAVYEERHTQQSNVSKKKSEQTSNALPGLPSLSFSPETMVPYDSRTSVQSPRIKKVLVRVLVNRDFPKSQARKAEKALVTVLGLNPDRGDAVVLDYERFYFDQEEAKQKIEISTTGDEKLASYQNLFYLLMIIFIIIFIVLYIYFQLKQANALSEQSGGGSGDQSINVNSTLEMPESDDSGSAQGAVGPGGVPLIKHYFDFIDDSNIENFIFLLKKEKIKAEYVSMIVSFVKPKIGAKILKELEIEEQAVVASQLLDQKLANRNILDKLEDKLKTSLESFFGGETKFRRIFDLVTSDDKKSIMSVLSQNDAVGYQRFRQNIMLFEDLKLLTDEEIELVVSDINLEMLATALISVDQDVYQRFDDNLNKSAKDMITQFLELKSQSTSTHDVEKAQEYILRVVKKLDASGKISLQEKIVGEE